MEKIITISDKKEERFLRKKTADFDFSLSKKDLYALISRMKRIMHNAQGVGLSANQIGLPYRIFVASVPDVKGGSKFYAIFNPKIEKASRETIGFEEGCLSVPGMYGNVERPERITLSGLDKNGKQIKIKAWGFLARVFQHEVDHLNGAIFTDKAKDLRKYENVRKYEK